jgi:mannose/cellobiose epimerase-like protein (N-acyl-D-glucosamine 2-epimerase family)
MPPELAAVHVALRRWLLGHAYELWWSQGADRVRGGFHERLRLDGTPTDEPRRARLHPRQVFAYSRAAQLGWRGPAAAAVAHGIEFFLAHYRRPDGLFRTLVAPDGAVLDERAVLYDQAFALLGLAAGYATLGDARLRDDARHARAQLSAQLANAGGGFVESSDSPLPLSANSHMHLLEACLEWAEHDTESDWRELAASVVELALSRAIDPRTGAVREHFDRDWNPAHGERGRRVEPGHQFEWAWLLLRYGRLVPDERLAPAALRLTEIGETRGVDATRGVAVNALRDDLEVDEPRARLWPQTERIKAACAAAQLTGGVRHFAAATQATRALLRYLDTPLRGLWRDTLDEKGAFADEPAPASSLYHLVAATAELERLAAACGSGVLYKTIK